MKRTLYTILGVDSTASRQEIAAAYQARLDDLLATPTPDPNAVALVHEAYQVLSNVKSRSTYDASLEKAASRGAKRREPEDPRSGWLKWVSLGIVLLVIAGIGWKVQSSGRPPSQPPVSVALITPQLIEKAAPAAEPEPPATATAVSPVSGTLATRSAEDLFSEVSNSIARVATTDSSGRAASQGSGVVIGNGTVVTNCHVVAKAVSITVKVGTDIHTASRLVTDEELDLCSLSVPGLAAPSVNVGSVGSLRIGQRVYAIGAPYGLDLTISEGIVSSLRTLPAGTVIQTTAPVSPGSSGGGLFDVSGNLVGIVTFQHRYGQNLNFAHPADWIGQMRTRTSQSSGVPPSSASSPPRAVAPLAPSQDSSPSSLILGAWRCLAGAADRVGKFHFGDNGVVLISWLSGHTAFGRYSIVGGSSVILDIQGRDSSLALFIQVLTPSKMVLKQADFPEWIKCDRK
ncbi:MAG: trypsin-like peptidase domain-containing protein [Candidatus Accumulibacter sp.]|uniref:Trypsin-like peptidase domain-containing protein n=1 Tax=Candidatus Accumulibacter affinis TaxID=2954384 RepID=A0A935W2X6_9PROT|nr:trypsin-like peptidase domain-containing protein [Candidatus Accumulibacter affinis]